jgi:hypothetical protein
MPYVRVTLRTLLPVALGLALLAPVAQAVNYNPATTITVYIHGFDADGPTSTWLAGDDSPNSDACGMWNDAQRLAALLGAPTWQQNPTAPNCVCAATYYGSTLPAWYSDQDRAEDAAFGSTDVVPKYALREAKYIRHCLNRAPGATSVHVMSASFGSLIARYMIEHNVLNLCSDGLISRWSPVVGVLRGNWLASNGDNLGLLDVGQFFGVNHADDPDIPQMNYGWVDANISAHDTLNSANFGPMVFNQFTATDDDQGYITLANNAANDNMNMNTDEYFAGYTTTAALHPATDGTLMMPGLAYYRNYHTGVRDNSAMWASLVAAAQNNKRVTIRLSRLKAKGEDGWPYNNKQWVYHATVVSPRSAVLYGNTRPVSDLAWEDGVSPKFSIGQDETTYPNTAVFDMIIPPGETQLQLTFTLETLENQTTYYNVLRVGYGGNSEEGTFALTIPTTQDSTVTVSNDNLEADLTTSVKTVYPDAPTAGNNGPVCLGATLSLTASTVSGATYAWTGPNGFTSSEQNPSIPNVTAAAMGTYSVTVTVSGQTSPPGTTSATLIPPPTITCPANVTVNADSGQCYATGVALGTPDTTGTGVSVGNDVPARFSQGTTTVTWTATDFCGATATCAQTVTVNDTQPPSITSPANVTVNADSDHCYATATRVALATPGTGDNCPGSISVWNDAPAQFQVGPTVVTWTAQDASGNTATCTQTVTVMGGAGCYRVVGCTVQDLNLGTPTTDDNCGVGSVVNNAPAVYALGTTVVTWMVTDVNGNTATTTQRVNVWDRAAPTITCPANVTVPANAGNTATNVALGSPVTADNCSVASVGNNGPAAYPLGTNVVIWTVTDGSGSTATCAQTVTVVSASVPPGNPTISYGGGVMTITWDGGVLQQSDDVLGTYTDVEGATSPWPVSGTDPQKFYRVRGTGP